MNEKEVGVIALLKRQGEKISKIEKKLAYQKNVLTFDEAGEFTGFSKSYLYKLTSGRKIKFSKPNNGSIFFDRKELEDWLMKNRIKTQEEIDISVSNISLTCLK